MGKMDSVWVDCPMQEKASNKKNICKYALGYMVKGLIE
jgi:hypothetical protein